VHFILDLDLCFTWKFCSINIHTNGPG